MTRAAAVKEAVTIKHEERTVPLVARLAALEEELVTFAERNLCETQRMWNAIKRLKADIKTLTTR